MHKSTILALTVRIVVSVCTKTYFQPDEYFQSLEPAHHLVFGYGHLTWEWMASQPIRSIFYPLLNVPIYWVLKNTGLSESGGLGDWLLILGPKILHGALAACTDIYLAEVTRRAIGPTYVPTVLLFSLSSFFNALALSRSLSNSMETTLTTIAFAYYPWDASPNLSIHLLFNRSRLRIFILFTALGCMVRPTNAVIWVFLYANLFWAVRHHGRVALNILIDLLALCLITVGFLFFSDSLYYGRPTFTPVNFLRTNLSSVSLFYGSNSWHYYLSQGIPILLTTALPFTLHGIWMTITKRFSRDTPLRTMLATILWSTGIYSLGGHKEWRFLHPILPLMHVFAAKSIFDLCTFSFKKKGPSQKPASTTPKDGHVTRRQLLLTRFGLPDIPATYIGFILLTIPVSLYVILFYCDAPISVLSYFRALPRSELGNSTIGVLMPCHSTPGFAYLHRQELANGGLWALGCEPPLQHQVLLDYKDQTTVFFDSPKEYMEVYFSKTVDPSFPVSPFPTSIPGAPTPEPSLSKDGQLRYPWRHEWPRHLVFFGRLLLHEGIRELLEKQGYQEVWKAGREWEGEGERKGGVRVWRWQP